jgi:hypothetical protein
LLPRVSYLQVRTFQKIGIPPPLQDARRQRPPAPSFAEVRESYTELGGTEPYWRQLEHEVMETALPQYIPAAIEQTRMEKS